MRKVILDLAVTLDGFIEVQTGMTINLISTRNLEKTIVTLNNP